MVSAGHVFVGEMNGSTITSQFPKPRGIEGANTTKTWLDTVAAEKCSPDYVYQVTVPNDKAFDEAAAKARNSSKWFAFPDGNNSTHCTQTAQNALIGEETAHDLTNEILQYKGGRLNEAYNRGLWKAAGTRYREYIWLGEQSVAVMQRASL
ncbi:MAG TPA: hypothetical protein VFK88_03375 [Gallionella sp.]|nr:hypothetical protein [Gallionella sp.]